MATFDSNDVQLSFQDDDGRWFSLTDEFDPDLYLSADFSRDVPGEHFDGAGLMDATIEITITYEVDFRMSFLLWGYNPVLAYWLSMLERLTLN